MVQNVTLIKRGEMSSASDPDPILMSEVIDLGLQLNEAAKILGVDIMADVAVTLGDTSYLDVAISFDPDDTLPGDFKDDEHFAVFRLRVEGDATTKTAIQTNFWRFLNFIGMNLVTARNLSMIVRSQSLVGASAAYNLRYIIYYERYIPSPNDLNQLIAWRR